MDYRAPLLKDAPPRPSYRRWLFRDRADAGRQLATALRSYQNSGALVVAIAPGGVKVAREVQKQLGAQLDVIVVQRLKTPTRPPRAFGAITADGTRWLNREAILALGLSDSWLERCTCEQRSAAAVRQRALCAGAAPLERSGRTVILIDDGILTGATMRAAIASLDGAAERLVIATPVGVAETCARLAEQVDELCCLSTPEPFHTLETHYETLPLLKDEELTRILRAARSQAL